jgi:hypothetical protein
VDSPNARSPQIHAPDMISVGMYEVNEDERKQCVVIPPSRFLLHFPRGCGPHVRTSSRDVITLISYVACQSTTITLYEISKVDAMQCRMLVCLLPLPHVYNHNLLIVVRLCRCTGTKCWVCDRSVLSSVPFEAGLVKTEVRKTVRKGLGACKLGMASREFNLPCGAKVIEGATEVAGILLGGCTTTSRKDRPSQL